jgi:kynureninase
VNEKYASAKSIPRFAGWWGHNEKERFLMKKGFKPIPGAEGWQLSNAPVFSMALHKASLDIFQEAGMNAIVKKSQGLTGFLEHLICTECRVQKTKKTQHKIKIITPGAGERGSQLSILIRKNGRELFKNLKDEGFVVDWRSPNVIRVAPVPLYNTFEEVYNFSHILSKTCCHE